MIRASKMMWHACSYGAGPRHWYVKRDREVASDSRGNYRRFASYEAANRVAKQLNESESK